MVCNMSGTGRCKGWKHSPTICHGIIHKTLKQHTSREFFHCIGDVVIRGKTLEELLSNGQQVIFIFPNLNWLVRGQQVNNMRKIELLWL